MSTINMRWAVRLVREAEKELGDAPPLIRKKFDRWVLAVEMLGPYLKGGWRTEALSGNLRGFYSVRLSQKWRVIFEVERMNTVIVIRIVAHDYARVRRS